MKGRNAWSKRTADNIQEGAKFFEKAIEIDPNYAAAYAGLADCCKMLVNYSVLPGSEAFPKAKDAAEKALALDENLAEPMRPGRSSTSYGNGTGLKPGANTGAPSN